MANDREAELKITTRLVGTEEAAGSAAELRGEIEKGGDAAAAAAGQMQTEAAAVSTLADAQGEAAVTAERAAGAIRETADAAQEAAQRTATASAETAEGFDKATASVERLSAAEAQAGAIGADAGADIAQAADKATSEIDQLTAAWNKEVAAARAAGQAFDANVAVGRIRELATAIRSSGADLEAQEASLRQLADTIETEYRQAAQEAKEFGGASAEQSRFAREAMTLVSEEIEKVRAQLAALGDTGKPAFDEIKTAALTFGDAAKNAIAEVNNATEQYNETSRITPRQLGFATQAVEALRMAMQEQAAAGTAGTVEQIALLQRLETQLTDVTLRANALTNASKDNAVRLRESGVQVQGLAMGVQQLTQVLGPQAATIGLLIGNAGQLGGAYEELKDSIAAMNLNTLQLNQANAAAATQIGAVALTALAGAAAGRKLAETSSANRQEIDRLVASLTKLKDDVIGGAISRIGGAQDALQKMTASTAMAVRALLDLDSAAYIRAMSDLKEDTIGLGVAMERGGNAARTYYALLNGGFSSTEALTAVTQEATRAAELHTRALEIGEHGVRAWNDAIANSGNTATGLAREMSILPGLLDDAAAAAARDAEAKKTHAEATGADTTATRNNTAAIQENLTVQQLSNEAATRAATGSLVLERAINGTSEAVNVLVRSIAAMIPESDRNTIGLRDNAAALSEAIGKLDGLSAGERARIKDLVELATRGEELNAVERARAIELARAIESGARVTGSEKDRAAALLALIQAMGVATSTEQQGNDVTAESIAIGDEHTAALLRKLEIVREQIGANEAAGASTDFLRMQEAALAQEAQQSLVLWPAKKAAQEEESDERAKLSAIIEKEKAANDALAGSHRAIVAVQEEGRIVYKNVGEEVENTRIKVTELKNTTSESALEIARNLTQMRQNVQSELRALVQDFDALGEAVDRVKKNTKDLGTVAKETAGGA